ncbi:CPBP family intramembrane glutamic endopeptidase [Bacillus sp. 31A1R]|uniref:CPBP family intramembrane glutamic endopeptidase n=1 Tax=Robertmurraya mangrovi TaxID=3098077 RepID=A0ABU5J128_9BACI|nr:CPBP family intramembrane glutamic endopeptidase [Bacillus sp. 31A1R]MDZ5473065.1 CPBP family intramembrane glutamic endopeptidase [Bacillus sp. 31A1R]
MSKTMTDKNKKIKEFSLKEATPIIGLFSLILSVLILALTMAGKLPFELYLSFKDPIKLFVSSLIAFLGLMTLGIVLTLITPAHLIDDTNKSLHNESLFSIIIGMFIYVLFEELLYRGLIQNFILLTLNNEWIAILATTFIFVMAHTRYFKKPIMLLNIILPGFIFCWIYNYTNNLLVPITIHFLTNVGMTLLFKYKLLKIRGNVS